jgi:hypothetical protein
VGSRSRCPKNDAGERVHVAVDGNGRHVAHRPRRRSARQSVDHPCIELRVASSPTRSLSRVQREPASDDNTEPHDIFRNPGYQERGA